MFRGGIVSVCEITQLWQEIPVEVRGQLARGRWLMSFIMWGSGIELRSSGSKHLNTLRHLSSLSDNFEGL